MKKIISIMLALIMIVPLAVFASAYGTDDMPIVFVAGKGDRLIDENGELVYPVPDFPDGYLMEKVREILPMFAKALITNDYEEWSDALANAISPYYSDPIMLDKNGDNINGIHTQWSWNPEALPKKTSGFELWDYQFRYDWRLDPMIIADQLDEYITAVLAATGASKVNLIGRCYGGTIVTAYLSKYGCEKVDTTIYYANSTLGVEESTELYRGNIHFDPAAIDRYATDNIDTTDDPLMGFVVGLITTLRNATALDYPLGFLNMFFDEFGDKFMPKILRQTYGIFPGIWSTIGVEAYEEAKEYVFGGYEEEYAGLIEKIDSFHYNVVANAEDILLDLKEQGMNVSVITKCGRQSMALFGNQNEDSDDLVAAYKASFGATFADHEKTLPASYIEERTAAGFGDYISPDNRIDGSTALFPDYTWYIKNSAHVNWCGEIDGLMMEICRFDGQMTVNDSDRYTQFMLYDEKTDSIRTMTAEDNGQYKWSNTLMDAIMRIVKAILRIFSGIFSGDIAL